MPLLQKLAETLRFLRYGPTRLAEANARIDESALAIGRLEQRARELQEYLGGVHEELRGHAAYTAAHLAEVRQEAAATKQAVEAGAQSARRDAEWTRNQVSALGAAIDRMQRASGTAQAAGAAQPASAAAAEEGFYPTLEHHFRGSPQDLRERLGRYRRWIEDLPEGPVGDLGCGRGEWLELLAEWGVKARGVDLNAPNVEGMRARGLDAQHADLMDWLQAQPDNSFAALTSFHVAEHLPFGILLRLVQEARRVLRPGGRLILETPNPENVIVATQTFWLDPTHVRPLPPALLELVVRDAGLELEATLRLNPPAEDAHEIADPTLRALMTQGRDCAVVGRKAVSVA